MHNGRGIGQSISHQKNFVPLESAMGFIQNFGLENERKSVQILIEARLQDSGLGHNFQYY